MGDTSETEAFSAGTSRGIPVGLRLALSPPIQSYSRQYGLISFTSTSSGAITLIHILEVTIIGLYF